MDPDNSSPTTGGFAELAFDLRLGHGSMLGTKLVDRGITLSAETLAYPVKGKLGTSRYSDVTEVRLAADLDGMKTSQRCFIKFASGDNLCVSSKKPVAKRDVHDQALYDRFLMSFHHHLLASKEGRHVSFSRGITTSQLVFMLFFCLVMSAAVPIILQGLETSTRPGKAMFALLLLPIGIAFFLWTAIRNWPRPYDAATLR